VILKLLLPVDEFVFLPPGQAVPTTNRVTEILAVSMYNTAGGFVVLIFSTDTGPFLSRGNLPLHWEDSIGGYSFATVSWPN